MIDFLHDHRGFLLLVTLLVWAWFISAIIRSRSSLAAAGAGPLTPPMGRQPIGAARKDIVPQQRTSTGGLAPSIEAGVAEHKVRGSAATAKLQVPPPREENKRPTDALRAVKSPPPPPTPEQLKTADKVLPRPTTTSSGETKTDGGDAEAMEGLFAGLKDKGPEAPVAEEKGGPGTRALRKANRIEEIGFHHQIPSDKLPAQPPAPPAPAPVPAVQQKPPTTAIPAAAAPAAPPQPPAPTAPPKPRTQTAELDDILKRIDKVLAENPTPAEKPAAPPPPPAPPKPATERLDPSDVLKRIDQALAESRGDSAAEVTMLDPDWEDDAKAAATVEAKPAEPAPPKPADKKATNADEDLPDWAKQDAEDEKDTKSDDGKGGGPGQQKLF